jgi:phosphoribosylanthranilate isomerase
VRPRIKICGITNYDDASLALKLGADDIGFIFAPSPRRVEPTTVASILERLRDAGLLEGRRSVGVFVNETPERMEEIMGSLGLSLAQIHGDESPELCTSFGFPWYRALRLRAPSDAEALAGVQGGLWTCARLLFDTAVTGSYGGTGKRVDGATAREAGRVARAGGKEFFLAGGLGPDNAVEVLRETAPDGLDVNSGVEESPGKKSERALRLLFAVLERHNYEERRGAKA